MSLSPSTGALKTMALYPRAFNNTGARALNLRALAARALAARAFSPGALSLGAALNSRSRAVATDSIKNASLTNTLHIYNSPRFIKALHDHRKHQLQIRYIISPYILEMCSVC